jgi:beta-lactamase regulating signal transducer with metallopeptidase domain
MPDIVLALGAVSAVCVLAARRLAGAEWPRRSPAVGIALWQALGLSWGLATVGVLVGLGLGLGARSGSAPTWQVVIAVGERPGRLLTGAGGAAATHLSLLTVVRTLCLASGVALLVLLCWILGAAVAAVLRARHRQRMLLGLLAHGDPKVPGVLVVDHPAAAAYCLPGLRASIVVSAGALDLLSAAELAAVLAHERAHLRARHDLVLLPFVALLRAFRWSATARNANHHVALLVEMLADDRARRCGPARELATALLRVAAYGAGPAPAGALAASTASAAELTARVTRLLRPQPKLPVLLVVLVSAATAVLALLPAAALLLPWGVP